MTTEVIILNYCWEELKSFKDKDSKLTIDMENRSLSYIEDGHTITEADALEQLDSWIRRDFVLHKPIYLYSCPDNALISLDDIAGEDMTDSPFETIIPNKFYHGRD